MTDGNHSATSAAGVTCQLQDWKLADARMLTEVERQWLVRLMYLAFCDLRGLALKPERLEQAHDLADAFHNVPLLLFTQNFSIQTFKRFIEDYQRKYEGRLTIDYLKEWERLTANAPAP